MKYNPTEWNDSDIITKEKLNKPEIALCNIVNSLNTVLALSEAIMGSMYQAPTFTKYVTTITPVTSVSGSITNATILQILGNDKLSELTSVGTDNAGNNKYNFIINNVTIGAYTKSTMLSDIMFDINDNDNAGVSVSYSEEENQFTFTSKEAGAGGKIEIDSGLAGALFDQAEPIDPSSITFASSYGLDWLREGETLQITTDIPSAGSTSFSITKDTSLSSVLDNLNMAYQQKYTFACNKYTGEIEARQYKSGAITEIKMTNEYGRAVKFNTANAPANPFTYGKNGIFTNIKVNGTVQPIVNKEVNIEISTST